MAEGIIPVSYTHLDVYKRQPTRRLTVHKHGANASGEIERALGVNCRMNILYDVVRN